MTRVKDSVKREIVVQASLEKVWDALTKEEHLNRWYTKEAEVDFRVGGKLFMNHGWGATSEGIITEIEELKRFVLQSADGDFTTITELENVENGIRVSIEYRASFLAEMDAASKENMLFGTGQFLENLKSVYEIGQDNRGNLWRTWIGIIHSSNSEGMGTKISKVMEGSVASQAGLIAGDIILGIDQDEVTGYESFERLLNSKDLDKSVKLTVQRDSEELELDCKVVAYPVAY
ncbi:SRPBCC domain-containing protein [Ornithinibacillus scapharcae]|uniref:SRPBCC domain-containing protein n=1 Tax=Ornithinibacillus scapharcae TaxID=1147159 RepID=UPI000225B021|nr:SRPBCC domain-containing protein [Ornithinibacillus scapharcae]